jgi:hypothetical protein
MLNPVALDFQNLIPLPTHLLFLLIAGIQGTVCKGASRNPAPGGWAYITGGVPSVSIFE